MPSYKLFLFSDGTIVGEAKRTCRDDLDALDEAYGLCRDHMVEVYSGIRFVARIQKGEEPLLDQNVGPARRAIGKTDSVFG